MRNTIAFTLLAAVALLCATPSGARAQHDSSTTSPCLDCPPLAAQDTCFDCPPASVITITTCADCPPVVVNVVQAKDSCYSCVLTACAVCEVDQALEQQACADCPPVQHTAITERNDHKFRYARTASAVWHRPRSTPLPATLNTYR